MYLVNADRKFYPFFISLIIPQIQTNLFNQITGSFNLYLIFVFTNCFLFYQYLHSFGVAHRDLKPENILMAENTENSDLKIVDFGLSKIIGPNETSLDPFGTLSYVAPEVLLQKPYGKEVDLWSIGVIMYLLLSRVLPFDDEDDREIARQTIYDPPDFSFHPWDKVSKEGKDLCKRLLEKNRHKRPSLEEVLNHPWFGEFKDIHNLRSQAEGQSKFQAYTLTEPNSPKIKEEIDKYSYPQ